MPQSRPRTTPSGRGRGGRLSSRRKPANRWALCSRVARIAGTLKPTTPHAAPALAPLVPGRFPLYNLPAVANDPFGFFTRVAQDFGPAARLRFGPLVTHMFNSPEAAHELLVSHAANYRKGVDYEGLKVVLGDGLVTSDGELWRRQRRVAQPAFHKERLAELAQVVAEQSAALSERWRGPAARGETIDLHRELMRFTYLVVSQALFGDPGLADADEVGEILNELLLLLSTRSRSVQSALPLWMPLPMNRRVRALRARLFAVTDRIVARPAGRGPLLLLLLSARDEAGAPLPPQLLRDEVTTILLAGHETSANTMTWALALLAHATPARERVFAELAPYRERALGVSDLASLPYLGQVINESLRLYPPSWILSRRALADDTIAGYRIPKGDNVMVSQYLIHRLPSIWKAPLQFDPDRFSPERVAARPKLSFLPFGAGPRQCIGNQFALLEATLGVGAILSQYDLALEPGQTLDYEPAVTLRPKHGVRVKVRARFADHA